MFELRRRSPLHSQNDGPIFSPGKKKKTHTHNAAPPLLALLLSLKLHRFQQRYTSSAGCDCTGLLAPSLHQRSCSLKKGPAQNEKDESNDCPLSDWTACSGPYTTPGYTFSDGNTDLWTSRGFVCKSSKRLMECISGLKSTCMLIVKLSHKSLE